MSYPIFFRLGCAAGYCRTRGTISLRKSENSDTASGELRHSLAAFLWMLSQFVLSRVAFAIGRAQGHMRPVKRG